MKKTKKILTVIISISLCIYCLLFPESVKAASAVGTERCISVIIPSLYAMMTASALLIGFGIISSAGRYISPVTRLIFGMNGETGAVFLFSMIAGYPVGAKMICSLYDRGRISKRSAEILSGLCFGSGTAFIFGCAVSSAEAGKPILLSNILANLITAVVLSPYLRKNYVPDTKEKPVFSANILNDSIVSSGRSMFGVCLCIIIFSVFSAMLRDLGLLRLISGMLPYNRGEELLCAILDVTAVSGISSDIPMISALLSFGGICVFFQITSIFRGKLSVMPLMLMRCITGVLSYGICRILMPYFITVETEYVFAPAGRLYREASPVPSVMLMIMTLVLIAESIKAKKQRTV